MRFEAFTLDLSRCVLLRGDTTSPLRPKPFDMLCLDVAAVGSVPSMLSVGRGRVAVHDGSRHSWCCR